MVGADKQPPLGRSDRCADVGALVLTQLRLMKQLKLIPGFDHEDLAEVTHQVNFAVSPRR